MKICYTFIISKIIGGPKMAKRRKANVKKIARLIILLALVIIIVLFTTKLINNLFSPSETMYISSTTNQIDLYDENLKPASTIYRGTKVEIDQNNTLKDNKEYIKLQIDKKTYYINRENLVKAKEKIVQEEKIYIRTATVLLKEPTSIDIVSNLPKTTELQVISYDKIDEQGNINMYKVKYKNQEGYVYGKYTVLNQAQSQEKYNLEVHKKIKNLYGGGEVDTLDFFPVEKIQFENNKMPESVYSLYLNGTQKVLSKVDDYIALAKETKINSFVVDIKDNGSIGYESEVMKEISPTSYKYANNTKKEYTQVIQKLKDAGFYVIGRITVFKDDYYVQDHPENAIVKTGTTIPYKIGNSYWPTAYSRDVWEYNVSLALEAIEEFGFNEINFDYVRFPDRTQKLESNNTIDFKNEYNEDKVEAIQNFLRYAADAIHQKGAYISVDVFGESSNNYYTTAYGQYWPALSNVVDVISAMPYPDHFANNSYGINKPWNHPYDLINAWSKEVIKRQNDTTSPAIVRTWVQAYNVQGWVDPNGIEYNGEEVQAQIQALYDNNLTGGYITWHSGSNIEKYNKQKSAFKIDYLKE